MQVYNNDTSEPIPYASWTIPTLLKTYAGEADANGEINTVNFAGMLGQEMTISAAGYEDKTVTITNGLNQLGVGLDSNNGNLSEVVVTAFKKAKTNWVLIVIIILAILAIVYRKQIAAAIKK